MTVNEGSAALVEQPVLEPDDTTGAVTDANDEQIAALEQQLAEQRRKNEESEAARVKAEAEREAAIHARVGETEAAVANAIARASNEVDHTKDALQRAFEAGDYKSVTDLQAKLNDQQAELRSYTGKKTEIDNWKDQQRKLAAQPKADPYANLHPRSRAWIKDHPRVLNDPRFAARVQAYALEAEDMGLKPDDDAYYAHVEERAGLRQATQRAQDAVISDAGTVIDADNGDDVVIEPTPKPAPPRVSIAATPSRGNGNGQPKQKQQVRLTESEREIAVKMTSLGNTDDERIKAYALNKLDLMKAGRLTQQ